ncbi:Rv3654c family TadE-like protein [Actinomyces sp.]|uniref:Rv3654c family TadE-like protein n=1 Tax=Actinomyces sp. TaxID=29317 RepID=UPI0026DBB158|nr:Rv3654c family TadE-like protein [Actinomyces sp.]MDO4900552.1 flp pilus-assembly TadE/G-like family protein [Actinomyces sp.]
MSRPPTPPPRPDAPDLGAGAGGAVHEGPPPGTERGSGTVMVLGIIAVVLSLALGATGLIQAQAAAGRARSAADLAALAGATALTSVFAPADPCATAQQVARANGAELADCTVDGEDVTVTVAVPTRILGIPRRAGAAARAGPVNPL